MSNINIGIDLGTTNSGIGIFKEDKVTILKNPVGFKETLPSVVFFKNERIIVGDKANEQIIVNPQNVFSAFKRKMGSTESYYVETLDKKITPVELSTYILKELSHFAINTDIDSVVITIPASFDTIQSNATKTAGINAGFNEVVLLQEPIAACLAYANENSIDITEEKKWLVYDFGGGTFDVAIVKINERELKIIDHKGNNFLGGVDIDIKILTEIIIPKLSEQINDPTLDGKLKSQNNTEYLKFSKYLLYKTEELKKELTLKNEAWLEVNYAELNVVNDIKITRQEINTIVKPIYDESFTLVEELLAENNLSFNEFERVILVGGTTYIPFIRESLKISTNIIIDSSIDPTTAVILGATYYASSKPKSNLNTSKLESEKTEIDFILSYEKLTKDDEELIAFKSYQPFEGFYRIIRNDGGFDSGMIKFANQANEFVSLLPKQINHFTITIFDGLQNLVYSNKNINISHGFYNINGQPLPNDICIELDDERETYLEVIFNKKAILPLKKTIYKTFSKSVAKGSNDKIIINIVEGKAGSLPGANLNIGYIEIKGTDLDDDLIKGTDIEITFKISESRDLSIEIYIPSSEQEIVETFNPKYQNEIGDEKMLDDIRIGMSIVDEKLMELSHTENYEQMDTLTKLKDDLKDLKGYILLNKDGILTDNKYQLMEKKRKLLYQIDRLNYIEGITKEIEEYKNLKNYLLNQIDKAPHTLKKDFEDVIKTENSFLKSGDKFLIRRKIKILERISNTITFENEDNYFSIFISLKMIDSNKYNNYSKVKKLLNEGEKYFSKNEAKQLKAICMLIISYLKETNNNQNIFLGTGLK